MVYPRGRERLTRSCKRLGCECSTSEEGGKLGHLHDENEASRSGGGVLKEVLDGQR